MLFGTLWYTMFSQILAWKVPLPTNTFMSSALTTIFLWYNCKANAKPSCGIIVIARSLSRSRWMPLVTTFCSCFHRLIRSTCTHSSRKEGSLIQVYIRGKIPGTGSWLNLLTRSLHQPWPRTPICAFSGWLGC